MKIAALCTALCALLFSSGADARSYHHHHHSYQGRTHPMVAGLGIGLIYMLRASRQHEAQTAPGGPSSMPTYGADTYPAAKSQPVKAHEQWVGHHRTEAHYTHVSRTAGLDSACRSAARQGGPCGCWAQEYFFHSASRLFNGANLWLAREWAHVFPHVAAAPGTAAVWPGGHHVAPVVGVNGDGTVTVADSWGTHAVRMARLTFVRPGGGHYANAY